MKSKRLGRGLEALIPQVPESAGETAAGKLTEVRVEDITANPYQPRTEFDRKMLDELKQSIAENGIIQPITIRKTPHGYELIAGERRLRAVQELGYDTVPAFLVDVDSDEKMLELALVENIQRENLNPIEVARALHQLMKSHGLTQETVAQRVGKERATVANFVRLLRLPAIIQESIQKGAFSMGHAKALMGLESEKNQVQVWKKCVEQSWSVRKLEETVRDLSRESQPGKQKRNGRPSPRIQDLEDRLRGVLGTQVKVHATAKGGRIEIHYFSDEELDRILDLIEG